MMRFLSSSPKRTASSHSLPSSLGNPFGRSFREAFAGVTKLPSDCGIQSESLSKQMSCDAAVLTGKLEFLRYFARSQSLSFLSHNVLQIRRDNASSFLARSDVSPSIV